MTFVFIFLTVKRSLFEGNLLLINEGGQEGRELLLEVEGLLLLHHDHILPPLILILFPFLLPLLLLLSRGRPPQRGVEHVRPDDEASRQGVTGSVHDPMTRQPTVVSQGVHAA